MMKKISLIISIMLLLTGCARPTYHTHLQQLRHLSAENVQFRATDTNSIRMKALRDTALGIAAQASLNVSARAIDARLKRNAKHLDENYNFNTLIIHKNILPPVLVEGRNTLNIANDAALRISDRTYQIVKQARFVSTPPTWRDYLWMNYPKPSPPDHTLLPKTQQEQKVWREYIDIGWKNGAKQAAKIFQANLDRLQRDYNGMILYRKLLAQHMVSAPFVVKSELGVTGGGNAMRVNDKILRITTLPALDPNSKKWKPALIDQSEEKAYE